MSSLVMARSFRLVGVAGEIVGAGEAVLNNSRAEGTNLGIERPKGSVGRADAKANLRGKKAVLETLAEVRTKHLQPAAKAA